MLSPIALTFRSCGEFTETGFIMVAISSMVTIEINPRRDIFQILLFFQIFVDKKWIDTLIYAIAVILKSTELPLTLTVGNKSGISYTVGIQFTDSQFHNGILSCPFLMEQSDLSQRRRKLPKAGWTSSNVLTRLN